MEYGKVIYTPRPLRVKPYGRGGEDRGISVIVEHIARAARDPDSSAIVAASPGPEALAMPHAWPCPCGCAMGMAEHLASWGDAGVSGDVEI